MNRRAILWCIVLGGILGLLAWPAMAEQGRPAAPGGLEEPVPKPVEDAGVGEQGEAYPPQPLVEREGWLLGKVEPAVELAHKLGVDIDVVIYFQGPAIESSPAQIESAYLPILRNLAKQVREIDRKYRPAVSLREAEERAMVGLQQLLMSPEDRDRKHALALEMDRLMADMHADVQLGMEASLRPTRDGLADFIEARGGSVGATILSSAALGARIPSSALMDLAEHPVVTTIVMDPEVDYELNVSVPSAGYTTFHNDGLDGGALWDGGVVDSGVQENHPDFAGIAFFSDTGSTDTDGHGTHVAGIMASGDATYQGTAFNMEKMIWGYSGNQSTTMSRMDTMMNLAATTDAPEVINHSLGYGRADGVDRDTSNPPDGIIDDPGAGDEYNANDSFYDAFVQNYNIQVTKSAGNNGWSNTLPTITHPAPAYNILVVANMNDLNTTTRTDDVRAGGSSVGPTLNGRRKPDIAAPGTGILSTNAFWTPTGGVGGGCRNSANTNQIVSCGGTSMAAPHIAGSIVLLEDGGNFDPQTQKAVLLNTADWWTSSNTSTTTDDGAVATANGTLGATDWDKSYGWGYVDMTELHFNRNDVFTASLVPSNNNATEDDYKLYVGTMFANEKATMTWEKRGGYVAGAAASPQYSLADINLRLYDESNGSNEDYDLDGDDNVHQVVAHSSGTYVIKPYAWSTSFSGATTETIALATEENFVLADFPETFQGVAIWPATVQPNEQFAINFWVRNDSTLASHGNSFDLVLPAGFTRISGADPVNVGSAPGGGGDSPSASWTIQASGTNGAVTITSQHSHSSYDESYGVFSWNMGVTVVTDTTPPTPNPMFWSLHPFELNTSQIRMTATTASDEHGPVEYYHDYNGSPTGGTGGTDSGWTTAQTFTDSGLLSNHNYCYRIWARDAAITGVNQGTPSVDSCDYTDITTPLGITFSAITPNSMQARSTNTPLNLTFGSSGLQVQNVTTGDNSGWKQNNNYWTSLGLTPNTPYSFRAYARNGDGSTTPFSPTSVKYTLAATPTAGSIFPIFDDTTLRVTWGSNGNPAGTSYLVENLTLGTNSGWITSTLWDNTGLTCGASYTYRVQARNGDLIGTALVTIGTGTPGFDFDGDTILNCFDPDDDNDGVNDPVDCLPFDAVAWDPPSEAQALDLQHATGITSLGWLAPVNAGTTGLVFYDTIMSKSSDLWGLGDGNCEEHDDGDLQMLHGDTPELGAAYFFIVRPENRCGNGDEGSGVATGGGLIPRGAVDCGCAHAKCDEGVALDASCDSCVAAICAVDDYCCTTAWDSVCVGEVASVCGDTCP